MYNGAVINIAFTVLSLAVLVIAVAVRGDGQIPPTVSTTNQVLSETSEATASPTPTEESTPSPSASASASPVATKTPTPTPTSTASPVTTQTGGSISTWIYPGSNVSSQTDSKLTMTVNGDPKVITAWYRDKMNGMGFNAKSVIQTQSNEKTLNKLSGASSTASLLVEIKRDTESAPLVITVDLTASNSSI